MLRRILQASVLSLAVGSTCGVAAPTDVVFLGGGHFSSTSGCEGWNPDKEFFVGTYWVPVAQSTNGPDSVITFHFGNGTAEGFQRDQDVFSSNFKRVDAVHVFTRIGTYSASVKVTEQKPETIRRNTQSVSVTGAVKGWDRDADCIVNFRMNLVRNLQP
jgi:hypothetical protein